MAYNNILVEKQQIYRRPSPLTDPKKLNALNRETIQELHDAFDELEADEDIKVIILTGSGEKAFVAGADISEFADFSEEEGGKLAAQGQNCCSILWKTCPNRSSLRSTDLPWRGPRIGHGLPFQGGQATMREWGFPKSHWASFPDTAVPSACRSWSVRVGRWNDHDRRYDRCRPGAWTTDLVNHVVSQENLLPFCDGIGGKNSQKLPVALGYAIKAVNAGFKNSQRILR